MERLNFPFYHQADAKDCGPTCLRIIAKHYKKAIPVQNLRDLSETTREGSSLLGISEAAEKIGFRSLGVKISLKDVLEAPLPCILHWNQNHYVVLYKIKRPKKFRFFPPLGEMPKAKGDFYISDPAHGLLTYTQQEFLEHWIGKNATENTEEGVALLLETTPKFYQTEFDKEERLGFKFLSQYIFNLSSINILHKKLV